MYLLYSCKNNYMTTVCGVISNGLHFVSISLCNVRAKIIHSKKKYFFWCICGLDLWCPAKAFYYALVNLWKVLSLQTRYYACKADLRLRSVEITEVICFYYASTGLLCCFKRAKSHLRCYPIGFTLRFMRSFRLEKHLWFIKITSLDFFS